MTHLTQTGTKVIAKIFGSEEPLHFQLDLSRYDKTVDDIIEIVCTIKRRVEDSNDSLFYKRQSAGEITIGTVKINGLYQNNIIAVDFVQSDYNKFEDNVEYLLGCFVQFSGDSVPNQDVDTYRIKFRSGIYKI